MLASVSESPSATTPPVSREASTSTPQTKYQSSVILPTGIATAEAGADVHPYRVVAERDALGRRRRGGPGADPMTMVVHGALLLPRALPAEHVCRHASLDTTIGPRHAGHAASTLSR